MKQLEHPDVVATVDPIRELICVTCGKTFWSDELWKHCHVIPAVDVAER